MAVNARFLAYPADTPQARDLETKAVEWTRRWTTDAKIGPIFASLVRAARGNPERPLENRAAWESAVHSLREQFTATQLGFGRTALFRIAPQQLIATEQDFQFSFESRKAELLSHWRGQRELDPFWDDRMEIDGQRSAGQSERRLRTAKAPGDSASTTARYPDSRHNKSGRRKAGQNETSSHCP